MSRALWVTLSVLAVGLIGMAHADDGAVSGIGGIGPLCRTFSAPGFVATAYLGLRLNLQPRAPVATVGYSLGCYASALQAAGSGPKLLRRTHKPGRTM